MTGRELLGFVAVVRHTLDAMRALLRELDTLDANAKDAIKGRVGAVEIATQQLGAAVDRVLALSSRTRGKRRGN